MKFNIRKIISFLNPKPPIAGVEISDFYLRFVYLKNTKLMNLDIRLTPGVIKDGKVIQKDKLKDAFFKLKQKLGKEAKKLPHIIIAIPSSSIFIQTFNLPFLAPEKVPEAAKLNMQMISPLPIEEAYADWDMLGENLRSSQITFLSVFTEKNNIDIIVSSAREVGFVVVAIEPSVFALERAVGDSDTEYNKSDFHILLNVTNDGMDFAGILNKKVHFDYFISWLSMYEGATEISPQVFENTVSRYTQQVLNFAMSNNGTSPKELILVASEFHDEIKTIIEKNFRIKVIPQDLFATGKLYASWGVSYGAYLRGLIPRGEDELISLTSLGTNEEFRQSQLIHFLKICRNIFAAYGATLVIIFFLSLIFLQSQLGRNKLTPVQALAQADLVELSNLKLQAKDFNDSVSMILSAQGTQVKIYPYINDMIGALTPEILLSQIDFQSISSPFVISGTASNDNAIKNFKQALENIPSFTKVDFPLNSRILSSGGRITFSFNISLKNK